MSSGFGMNGGRGRCFPFWQEFTKCYVQTDAPKQECKLQFEDYQECLYHRKELLRMAIVQDEYEKEQARKEHEKKP
ncbi:hypothetical protein PhCBS80983_g04475 [Powellomyces hirtus]|uniref:NADH dehydrogenase [ubiquinone] iron-sulfur protein 5 n=1 Tax=Powellomyces hirtus TaxID=109895 RepID=A0A507DYJ8_9FUNG|nr:hypothetical protein PhCBS80983_g04475 [Powellomyces hirtus]